MVGLRIGMIIGVWPSAIDNVDMKTLLILRHAKAASHPSGNDHDRPLNGRGEKQAPAVGKWLADHKLTPELIVSSTALRAHETAQLVAEARKPRGTERKSASTRSSTWGRRE